MKNLIEKILEMNPVCRIAFLACIAIAILSIIVIVIKRKLYEAYDSALKNACKAYLEPSSYRENRNKVGRSIQRWSSILQAVVLIAGILAPVSGWGLLLVIVLEVIFNLGWPLYYLN